MKYLPLLLTFASAVAAQTRDTAFRELADRYFDEAYFAYNPTAGTAAGFHQYDSTLEEYSRPVIQRQSETLQRFRADFERFGRDRLSPEAASDYDLVLANIRGTLLTLEEIRPWERNPDSYSGGITSSIFVIMSRNFAPAKERLR